LILLLSLPRLPYEAPSLGSSAPRASPLSSSFPRQPRPPRGSADPRASPTSRYSASPCAGAVVSVGGGVSRGTCRISQRSGSWRRS